ncbi:MAG TPA: ADP-ribosylglycohydrolase family protein [Casimicrobiaceae bacterium]|nr:ADP-ribosylglycohydrolase family protein [Casimicrobiaceae bacterium]
MRVRDDAHFRIEPEPALKSRYRGCMLGGAIGDALGGPVEFMSLEEIRNTFGRIGITEFTTAFGRKGAITDDTQMSLFTAEGLLRAWVRASARGELKTADALAHAYGRWLITQGRTPTVDVDRDGWLIEQAELHDARVPGATCLASLQKMVSLGERARNDSKGCGCVTRVAPVGLFCARLEVGVSPERLARRAFELGAEAAGLTHGHPTGRLAAGAFAAIIALLVTQVSLEDAVARIRALLPRYPGHTETLRAIDRAQACVAAGPLLPDRVVELGEGWVADEALAIALACALATHDFERGVRFSINHDGDSDSTAAITGNLLGALRGVESIPQRWVTGVEARRVITDIADDLATFPQWPLGEFIEESSASDYWRRRYPPS